jgi:hypothetical protein
VRVLSLLLAVVSRALYACARVCGALCGVQGPQRAEHIRNQMRRLNLLDGGWFCAAVTPACCPCRSASNRVRLGAMCRRDHARGRRRAEPDEGCDMLCLAHGAWAWRTSCPLPTLVLRCACAEEGHVAKPDGCRIIGMLNLKRVPGVISFSVRSAHHSFDASLINTAHTIKHLSFGDPLSEEKAVRVCVCRGRGGARRCIASMH